MTKKISVITELREDLNDILSVLYLFKNFNNGINAYLVKANEQKIRFLSYLAHISNIKQIDIFIISEDTSSTYNLINSIDEDFQIKVNLYPFFDETKLNNCISCLTDIDILEDKIKYINDRDLEIVYGSNKIFYSKDKTVDLDIEQIECNPLISKFTNLILMPKNVTHQLLLTNVYESNIIKSNNKISKFIHKISYFLNIQYDGSINLYLLASVLYYSFRDNYDIFNIHLVETKDGFYETKKGSSIKIARHIHKIELFMYYLFETLCEDKLIGNNLISLSIPSRYLFVKHKVSTQSDLFVEEIGREKRLPGSSFGPQLRTYFILHIVESGKGKLKIGDQVYNLKAKDCFILPNDSISFYESDDKDPITYYWIGFSGRNAKILLQKAGFISNKVYVKNVKSYITIKNILHYLLNLNINIPNIDLLYLGNLYLILHSLMTGEEEVGPRKDLIIVAKEFIDCNYMNHITVNDVANYINYDRTYFYRLFKSTYGISPSDYINNLRMNKAMDFLKKNIKPTEVAVLVGFNDYQTFYYSFKKYFNKKPNEIS